MAQQSHPNHWDLFDPQKFQNVKEAIVNNEWLDRAFNSAMLSPVNATEVFCGIFQIPYTPGPHWMDAVFRKPDATKMDLLELVKFQRALYEGEEAYNKEMLQRRTIDDVTLANAANSAGEAFVLRLADPDDHVVNNG